MTDRPSLGPAASFRHEAMLYSGGEGFVASTTPFIRGAVEAEEPILVVVSREKIDMLRSALGDDAGAVRFADMAAVGANPGRIISAWSEFVAEHAGSPGCFRGIGEPVYPERTADEVVECERHEALLNLAFAEAPAWWLACPYDLEALDPAVIEEARRNHPFVTSDGVASPSPTFRGLAEVAEPFARPLPDPDVAPQAMSFGAGDLEAVRSFVADGAAGCGLAPPRVEDLVLAANEVATNSLRHGGGRGVLRVWCAANAVVCEVRDAGRIEAPLVGRHRPAPTQTSGFGVWLANQVCDLVQVRSFADGSVVRLHMSLSH